MSGELNDAHLEHVTGGKERVGRTLDNLDAAVASVRADAKRVADAATTQINSVGPKAADALDAVKRVLQ